jgi:hypothetical protein
VAIPTLPTTICRASRDHDLLDAKQHGAHSCPFGGAIVKIVGAYNNTHIFCVFTPCAFGALGVEEKWLRILRSDAGEADAASGQLDEEQDVEALQEQRVDALCSSSLSPRLNFAAPDQGSQELWFSRAPALTLVV